jgi:phospholipid N-methyltransferase
MEQKQKAKQPATKEFVAEKVINLSTAFYDTPEELFDALIRSVLFLRLTESEVIEVFNEAIFTVRKTRVAIADVLGNIAEIKRKPVYNERTGETTYKFL